MVSFRIRIAIDSFSGSRFRRALISSSVHWRCFNSSASILRPLSSAPSCRRWLSSGFDSPLLRLVPALLPEIPCCPGPNPAAAVGAAPALPPPDAAIRSKKDSRGRFGQILFGRRGGIRADLNFGGQLRAPDYALTALGFIMSASTRGVASLCPGLSPHRAFSTIQTPANRAQSRLIVPNPAPLQPSDARRPIKRRPAIPLSLFAPYAPLGGKSVFSGSGFIPTTISGNLRGRRKFLVPRAFHPPSSIIHAS
jgi:hypothetical protein